MLAGLAFCEMQRQYTRSAFQGFCGGHQRRSAAVCDPNPPRSFAWYRFLKFLEILELIMLERGLFSKFDLVVSMILVVSS